jgi:hypothetical protein
MVRGDKVKEDKARGDKATRRGVTWRDKERRGKWRWNKRCIRHSIFDIINVRLKNISSLTGL